MTFTMPSWIQPISQSRASSALMYHRQRGWDAFLKVGLPMRKHERFNHADLSALYQQHFEQAAIIPAESIVEAICQHRLQHGDSILLVCVNGYLMETLSDVNKLPKNVLICSLQSAWMMHSDLLESLITVDAKRYPFASLNEAMHQDGLFLKIPDQCELTAPIHLLSMTLNQQPTISHTQHIIAIGKRSKVSIVDEHFSLSDHSYCNNTVMRVSVEEGAIFDNCKIQQEGKRAYHLAHLFIQQEKDSVTNLMHVSWGGQFSRDDIAVDLKAKGAVCQAKGFYLGERDDHCLDYRINIQHQAPYTESNVLYKGMLNYRSKAIFNGRIKVAKEAQKIIAHQANHNLLLSQNAEVFTKPELEIYADEVKCKHGATVGQLDQAALFYLRARGISEEEAKKILLHAFADDILSAITHPGIKMRVGEGLCELN